MTWQPNPNSKPNSRNVTNDLPYFPVPDHEFRGALCKLAYYSKAHPRASDEYVEGLMRQIEKYLYQHGLPSVLNLCQPKDYPEET